jgi:enterochelin esterase family protein
LAARASEPAGPAPFASLAELDQAMAEVERGGDVEVFWARVRAAGRMPLLFGDTGVFLHRAEDADKVEWRGDFNQWRSTPETLGRRLGESPVFTFRRTFLPGTRLDYKIVESVDHWLVDPLNPHQQLGGFGPNSEVRLPGWVAPAHIARRPEVPRGTFGAPELVDSKKLGYAVSVRVYVPAGKQRGRLPILYVTDGSDYWHDEMGGLTTTLDNLIADRRIPPLVAVFVDAWDPKHEVNRRKSELVPTRSESPEPGETCRFCEFMADELAPRIEARFRIGRRGILGTSLGGLHAAYMGYRYPDRFRLLAIQSPANERHPWLAEGIARARRLPAGVAIAVGHYEPSFLAGGRSLRDAFAARGVPVLHLESPDGHSWGHWRATVAPMLEYLYGEAR